MAHAIPSDIHTAADEMEKLSRELNRRIYRREAEKAGEDVKVTLVWVRNFCITCVAITVLSFLNARFELVSVPLVPSIIIFVTWGLSFAGALFYGLWALAMWVRKHVMLANEAENAEPA